MLREAEPFFTTLDQATSGRNPQEAVIEAFALGVRLIQDSPLYSRIAESETELFGMFSRSHVFPVSQLDRVRRGRSRCSLSRGTSTPHGARARRPGRVGRGRHRGQFRALWRLV